MSVERNSLWKSIRECNQNLNQVCEHEWGRDYDSYDPYSLSNAVFVELKSHDKT